MNELKVTVDTSIELAVVSSKTGEILVNPKFYALNKELQLFILTTLQYLPKNPTLKDFMAADELALDEVMKTYPLISKAEIIDQVISSLHFNREFNRQRIDNLAKQIYGNE